MNNTSNNDLGFSIERGLILFPEIVNAILLSLGARQMYIGIEISHPVFQVLFICLNNFVILENYKM